MNKAAYALIIPVLVVLCGYNIYDLKATITHPGDANCESCHLTRGKIDKSNASIVVASQEELCESCHRNALTASHPSGFSPARNLPENFPLDWKSELTCSTCHEVHGSKPGLLRVEDRGKTLCLSCHDENFFVKMKDHGDSVMSFGHLDARPSSGSGVDQYSIQCLSCHETLEGELNVQVRGGITRHNNSKASHPIGMNYQNSTSYGGYRKISLLPEEVALPNGMVSCISCHDGYSDKHGELVLANQGSGLCFSCHDL